MDFADYRKKAEKIRRENRKLLEDFASWLRGKGLSGKTVERHVSNAGFYINEFLLYDEATPAGDGIARINTYFGYWFIKKAGWASHASIKQNAASLKKFYGFMLETGRVSRDYYAMMNKAIKENMPEWQATLERYCDPEIEDMEAVWGF